MSASPRWSQGHACACAPDGRRRCTPAGSRLGRRPSSALASLLFFTAVLVLEGFPAAGDHPCSCGGLAALRSSGSPWACRPRAPGRPKEGLPRRPPEPDPARAAPTDPRSATFSDPGQRKTGQPRLTGSAVARRSHARSLPSGLGPEHAQEVRSYCVGHGRLAFKCPSSSCFWPFSEFLTRWRSPRSRNLGRESKHENPLTALCTGALGQRRALPLPSRTCRRPLTAR